MTAAIFNKRTVGRTDDRASFGMSHERSVSRTLARSIGRTSNEAIGGSGGRTDERTVERAGGRMSDRTSGWAVDHPSRRFWDSPRAVPEYQNWLFFFRKKTPL